MPVATTFAVFATRRALDFIAIQCALNRANVKIVAALPGIYSTFGPTHQGIDDLAHMRALPEHDRARPLRQRRDGGGRIAAVVELRRTRLPARAARARDRATSIAAATGSRSDRRSCCARAPTSASSTSGIMVRRSMDAAAELAERGIEASVLKVSTIKPFDDAAVVGARARDRRARDRREPLGDRRPLLGQRRRRSRARAHRCRCARWACRTSSARSGPTPTSRARTASRRRPWSRPRARCWRSAADSAVLEHGPHDRVGAREVRVLERRTERRPARRVR